MKKRVISILMVGTLAMGLVTGCGSGENAQDSQTGNKTSSGEKVTLSVLAGQSTTDAGIEEFIDAALEKKYPEIKLEWECVDWGNDFQPKMQQYMQSGLPDIMIGKAQDVSTYAPKGVLGEIDETYLDRGLDAARENVRSAVRFTPMIPAVVATESTSPFPTVPASIASYTSRLTLIFPVAVASLTVSFFSVTSTMRAFPSASKCVNGILFCPLFCHIF